MTLDATLYVFLLGFAAGMALLAFTAYRRVSPLWLRSTLILTAVLMAARYTAMAAFSCVDDPDALRPLRAFWLAGPLCLALPSAFAVDAILRHPAMTPRKLITGFSPFALAYLVVILFGQARVLPDPVSGWTVQLVTPWPAMLGITQAAFTIVFVGACALFIRKVPDSRIRIPLALLAAAHLWMGASGIFLASGGWDFRPYLFSEIFTLGCLWYALEAAHALQQSA